MIYFKYLAKLKGVCQGILIPMHYWGRFLRKIGGFKIIEVSEETLGFDLLFITFIFNVNFVWGRAKLTCCKYKDYA